MEKVRFPPDFYYHLSPSGKHRLLRRNLTGFALALPILGQSMRGQPKRNLLFVPLALVLADVFGYVFHMYTDESEIKNSGTSLDGLRIQNQFHHLSPAKILEKPMIYQCTEIFPMMMVFGSASLLFSKGSRTRLVLGVMGMTAPLQNMAHGYAHKQTHHQKIPFWISVLQNFFIISGPEHRHHHIDAKHQGHWSIFTPLSNKILDPLFESIFQRKFA